ncbi:MAG TPA: PilZ domain-containing protein [Allosphingosinicella sp.]|nr:PilZ domain-containing protein [Allosphingosinicella sp.]
MHEIRSLMQDGGKKQIIVRKAGERADHRRVGGLTDIAVRREESRKTNQRREDRHMNLADKAVITFRRKRIDVEIVNVSTHGVMIDADIEPRVGERINISIEDCNQTRCSVRWLKGRHIGLEFAEETVLIAPANVRQLIVSGRRAGEQAERLAMKPARAPRHTLILRAVLHCGIESHEVRLRNISANGAMLDCGEDLLEGAPVVLELAGGGAVAAQARVRWCRSGQIGLLFEAPFDMTLLADGTPVKAPASGLKRYVKPDYLGSEGDPDSPWAARTYGLRPEDL